MKILNLIEDWYNYLIVLKDVSQQQLQAERRLTGKLNDLFSETFEQIIDEVESQSRINFERDRRMVRNYLENIREPYTEILEDEGKNIAEASRLRIITHLQSAGLSIEQTELPSNIVRLIEEQALEAVDYTMGRISNDIIDIVQTGVRDGLGSDEVGKLIRAKHDTFTRSESERIARTEINNYSNLSAVQTELEYGVEYHQWITAEDERVRGNDPNDEADHVILHLQIVKIGDEFENGLLYPGDRSGPIEEFINCFIDYQVPIYTIEGWKRIGDIKVGDRVLTHKGRFKKVTDTLSGKKYSGEVVDLEVEGMGGQKLTMTPKHRVYSEDGWKEIKDINVGDKIYLASEDKCEICGDPIHLRVRNEKPKTCGTQKCKTRLQWKKRKNNKKALNEFKKKISESMKKQYKEGIRDKYEITKEANKVVRELIKDDNFALTNWIQEGNHWHKMYPELVEEYKKTIWLEIAHKYLIDLNSGTEIENIMEMLLNDIGVKYEKQTRIFEYSVDFYLPDYRIVIECDGDYWHNREDVKQKDKVKDARLHGANYEVLRFSGTDIKDSPYDCQMVIDRFVNNHEGQYTKVLKKVVSKDIREVGMGRKPVTLYNLAVEEDESYVAKGYIVHNCRCRVVPFVMPPDMMAPANEPYFYEEDLVPVQ